MLPLLGRSSAPNDSPPVSLLLSQKQLTQMVIEQSQKTKEITLKYQQLRLEPITKLSAYDWMFGLESGYDWDRNEGPTHPATLTEQTYRNSLVLKKSMLTGTTINFEYSRDSLYGNDIDLSNSKITQYTHDLLGFSIEQQLWQNAFGIEDRSALEAVDLTFQASSLGRASELQDLVLDALRLYWNCFVAQENFTEALSARDRYQRFVGELQRKTAYGYSNTYELFQIQAELENREQLVKSTSLEYLKQLDGLTQLLQLPRDTRIEFPKVTSIPDVPQAKNTQLEDLRQLKAQTLKVKAAEAALVAAQSNSHPILSVSAGMKGSGYSDTPAIAESRLVSGAFPKYFVGLKLQMHLGANSSAEEVLNGKAKLELEQIRYQRNREEIENKLVDSERKMQTHYFAVTSTLKQTNLREKTLKEMQRSYNNGRIDISLLIDGMNKYFSSRVLYTRSVGDYFIALNEWAAFNDELILNSEDAL
jgi:outer membrane protein TolC